MFEKYRRIHFAGIGGIGMSGIAEVLLTLGYEVTGSDLKDTEITRRLALMGAKVHIGHRGENVQDAHVVVVSSAVKPDNPEVLEARRLLIPVIPRAEMLSELARLKYSILVAGAHGKTTTTSLVASALGHGGLDPTIVIGGKLKAIGTNARLGQGEFLVAEADESDGSFLKLSPTIAVVTNIDREHMDFFRTMENLKEAFVSFLNMVPFYGLSVVCAEDPNLRELFPRIHRPFLTYGFSASSDIVASRIEPQGMSSSFEVTMKGQSLGRFTIALPGMHNVLNALACIGVASELTVSPAKIRESLSTFSGIGRRFELKGEARGIRVFDDYCHHPTEIRATLGAAKETLRFLGRGGKLTVIFQPHRYSRTADLMGEFARSFADADRVVAIDIYAAGEIPVKGVTSGVLVEAMRQQGHKEVIYLGTKDEAVREALSGMREGDFLFTIGAGDVWKAGETALEILNGN